MANLLFDWFGFDQTSKADANSTSEKQPNPNKIHRKLAVQWYFPPMVSVLCNKDVLVPCRIMSREGVNSGKTQPIKNYYRALWAFYWSLVPFGEASGTIRKEAFASVCLLRRFPTYWKQDLPFRGIRTLSTLISIAAKKFSKNIFIFWNKNCSPRFWPRRRNWKTKIIFVYFVTKFCNVSWRAAGGSLKFLNKKPLSLSAKRKGTIWCVY